MSTFLGNIKGPQGDNGAGVAPGGNKGERLIKKTTSDYDTEWERTLTLGDAITSLDDIPDNCSGTALVDASIWGGTGIFQVDIEAKTVENSQLFKSDDISNTAILNPIIYDDSVANGGLFYYMFDSGPNGVEMPYKGYRFFETVDNYTANVLVGICKYIQNEKYYAKTKISANKNIVDWNSFSFWYNTSNVYPTSAWMQNGRTIVDEYPVDPINFLQTNIPIFASEADLDEYLTTGNYSKAINGKTAIKTINMIVYENYNTVRQRKFSFNPLTQKWIEIPIAIIQ